MSDQEEWALRQEQRRQEEAEEERIAFEMAQEQEQERTELQRLADRYEARHAKWYSSPAGPAYGEAVGLRYDTTTPNGIDTGYNQLVDAFMEADADVSALLSLAAQSEELRAELERAENECRALVSARDNCEQQFQEQVNKTLAAMDERDSALSEVTSLRSKLQAAFNDTISALDSRRTLESRYSALVTAARRLVLVVPHGAGYGEALDFLIALLDSEASDQGVSDG